MHDCLVHLCFHGNSAIVLFLLVGSIVLVLSHVKGGAWVGVRWRSNRSPLGRSRIVIVVYVGVTMVTKGCLGCPWTLSSQIAICF
jgi:hypothetical protein